MEFSKHMPFPEGEEVAPDTLITGLKQRLELFNEYADAHRSEYELERMLEDPHWEVRCAALEQPDCPLPLAQEALNDENSFVRMAAVRAFCQHMQHGDGRAQLLQGMLVDEDWLVRETTLLTMGMAGLPVPADILEGCLNDASLAVREAAVWIQDLTKADSSPDIRQPAQFLLQNLPNQSYVLKGAMRMKTDQFSVQSSPETQTQNGHIPLTSEVSPKRRKRAWSIRIGLLAATMILLLASLTGAGFGLGWWNPLFGNPNLYQKVVLERSSQGVTIRVTNAYADKGRTVVVYDVVMADRTKVGFVGSYDFTGSFAQQQEPVQGTQCSAPQDGVQHCYLLMPAFNVPAQVNQLTLTWKITQVYVSPQGSSETQTIKSNWDFTFRVPFHHENNHQLPDPIKGGLIKG